jgi:hypothetical protein
MDKKIFMKKSVLALSALTVLLALSLAPSTPLTMHPPRIHIRDSNSTNWSGYAVVTSLSSPQKGAVSDVQGSWIVPSVDVSVTPNAYSSFWIGIDGYSSNTVEQIGTDSDTSSGTPQYYAWYEMYPKYPVTLNMKVSPGDTMSAEVEYLGSNRFLLTITDVTTGATFSTTQKSGSARRSSAEWIAEAPSSRSGVLPLADFGTVYFSGVQATLNGHAGSLSDTAWQYDAITMTTSSGTIKAQPSSPPSGGTGFSVTWYHQ